MDMIGKVRRMRLRKKLSISEIARTTGLSRPTVRKWLAQPADVEPRYERVSAKTKLSAFVSDGQEPHLYDGEATFSSLFDFPSLGLVMPNERA